MSDELESLRSLTPLTSSCSASTTESTSTRTQIQISITTTTTELQIAKNEEEKSHGRPSSKKYEINSLVHDSSEISSEIDEKVRSFDEEIVQYTPPPEGYFRNNEYDDEEEEDDDDTLSSEAMVDDIELILMPEETVDIPTVHSPKLVRVRELITDDSGHLVDDDDDEDECNFRKMDVSERSERRQSQPDESGDETEPMIDEVEFLEGAVGYTLPTFNEIMYSGVSHHREVEDDDPSFASSTTSGHDLRQKMNNRNKILASSSVQTDITALETRCTGQQPIICDYRSGRKGMTSSTGKKLNWKSELTLLPSKTKVGHLTYGVTGGGYLGTGVARGYNGDEEDDDMRDRYSTGCRVAKFTSQDNVLSSSSQFLKPSTLYRTRNLSRNLNQLGSSETSFILPPTETSVTSPRYRTEWIHHQQLSSGVKGWSSSSTTNQRRPPSANPFRSSLPDLSVGGNSENSKFSVTRRRQSHQYTRVLRSSYSGGGQGAPFGSSGLRKCRKKSSSDEETSSLIDESERCLRSSIDLLLTDDIPPPGYDYPYCSSSTSALGRRYSSQPILTEDAFFYREPRNKGMGSPFLPRRMADMRCSKYAKVILPDGQVSVVSVLEIDEIRDTLTVASDSSGGPIIIPFRKIVFAWRNSRR